MTDQPLTERVRDLPAIAASALFSAGLLAFSLYTARDQIKLDDARWCHQATYRAFVSDPYVDPTTVQGPRTNISCAELFTWETQRTKPRPETYNW